jgi:hypothetical protein
MAGVNNDTSREFGDVREVMLVCLPRPKVCVWAAFDGLREDAAFQPQFYRMQSGAA